MMMLMNNIYIHHRRRRADVRAHGVAHIICTTLLLIVISNHHHAVVAEDTPAATPTSLDVSTTYSPTTLSHANNVALHSLQGMGLRRLEDANDDEADEYTDEEYQEQYYNNNGDEYDETDDGQDETDDGQDETDDAAEEEGDDAVEEYQDDGQGDDAEENESEESEDSSQSQDYNDDENNMMNNQDYWYTDDPNMPTDDAVLQQLQTEWEAEQIAAMLEAEERRVAMYNRIREVSMTALSVSMSILGFLSTLFCTTILLYFMRVQSLMRRYNNEGIKVVGRILASEPDIESSMKWSNGGIVDYGPASISPIDDKLRTHDSYSMMTDDGSYIQVGMSSSSESNGSAAPQDHNSKSLKEDVETEGRVVQQQKADFNMQVLKEDEQRRHHNPIVSSVVSIAGGSRVQTKSLVKTRHINNNQTISQRKEHFNSETFRVLVEYDDVTYHDEINQDSSDIIRKRLSIKGEDIEEKKKSNNNGKQQIRVKLLVLKDEPNSGYSSGDISRALRWQKWLSFFIHVMVGCTIILAGVYTTKNIAPSTVYYIYIGMLLLQIPIMSCFLQKSFTKILSKEYLEDGLSVSSKASMKGGIDEEKMMSTLNSSSFGLV